jgi:hypothetical protein
VEDNMKKFAAVLAFGIALSAGAAYADTIQNGYGNTFVVTIGDQSVRYHFNEDGTFLATAPDGQTQSGRYETTADQICFLGEGDARQCAPLIAGKNVGDTWQQQDANGNEITVSIVAGR